MEQYISKSALVAEIERRVEAIANAPTGNSRELAAIQGAQQYELINLIQFINTLEVKEVQEEPVSVWHNEKEPYDETKPMLVIAINKTIHLWKGKFDTPEMHSAFCLCTATDISGKTYSIVSKWAYIDDLLKL